ncbi:MAG: HD domain-containing protein [Candidatus Kerfeldbacteria bacterium]
MVSKVIALPTREECERLWDEYHTPKHVREHMKQVGRVAKKIAEGLAQKGIDIDVELVDRAALLHDVVRVTEWKELNVENMPYVPGEEEIQAWKKQREAYPPSMSHTEVNYITLKDTYPELAEVVRTHCITKTMDCTSWEQKVLNYADRRVAHDVIVTVKERLQEGENRANEQGLEPFENYAQLINRTYEIENEIFGKLKQDADTFLSDL